MAFPSRSRAFVALAAVLTATWGCIALAAPPAPQVSASEQVREVVATLATGQVTILRGKDGLVVAAVGNSFEPDSFPPLIVPLSEGGLAVVLGADDWVVPPPTNHTLLRLDQQLPHLIEGMSPAAPSLRPAANISDLDQIGMTVLEPLRQAARNLHAHLHLPQDLPLAELVLVRRTEQEPLLVWDVSYWIRQTFWQENFWATEVERPRSMQLYPTKQDKSGIVQVSYPPGQTSPGVLSWISHPTGSFAQAIETDPQLASAQKEIADGKLKKVHLAQLAPLVKTALETMVPAGAAKALASDSEKTGFTWVIQPPVSQTPVRREPGAPSLENPPSLE